MTYRAVVITVSDRCYRGETEDKSGPALKKALGEIGMAVTATEIVPDEISTIVTTLQKYVSQADINLIITTGGTGFGPRDVTPEASRQIIERSAPGIAELLRQAGASQTPLSWLSRGEAGIAGGKLVINLPGSIKAMQHSVDVLRPLLFHALQLLAGEKLH